MEMTIKLANGVIIEFNILQHLYLKQGKDVLGPFCPEDISEIIAALRFVEKGATKGEAR